MKHWRQKGTELQQQHAMSSVQSMSTEQPQACEGCGVRTCMNLMGVSAVSPLFSGTLCGVGFIGKKRNPPILRLLETNFRFFQCDLILILPSGLRALVGDLEGFRRKACHSSQVPGQSQRLARSCHLGVCENVYLESP